MPSQNLSSNWHHKKFYFHINMLMPALGLYFLTSGVFMNQTKKPWYEVISKKKAVVKMFTVYVNIWRVLISVCYSGIIPCITFNKRLQFSQTWKCTGCILPTATVKAKSIFRVWRGEVDWLDSLLETDQMPNGWQKWIRTLFLTIGISMHTYVWTTTGFVSSTYSLFDIKLVSHKRNQSDWWRNVIRLSMNGVEMNSEKS